MWSSRVDLVALGDLSAGLFWSHPGTAHDPGGAPRSARRSTSACSRPSTPSPVGRRTASTCSGPGLHRSACRVRVRDVGARAFVDDFTTRALIDCQRPSSRPTGFLVPGQSGSGPGDAGPAAPARPAGRLYIGIPELLRGGVKRIHRGNWFSRLVIFLRCPTILSRLGDAFLQSPGRWSRVRRTATAPVWQLAYGFLLELRTNGHAVPWVK